MSVYSTMIRDDPDSRARLRVTPEQALNFPVHHCLASWIAAGTRIPSFIGQTYPLPDRRRRMGAATTSTAMAERVGPYPRRWPRRSSASPAHGAGRSRRAGGSTAAPTDATHRADRARHAGAGEPHRDAPSAAAAADGARRSARRRAGSAAAITGDGRREVRVDIERPPPRPTCAARAPAGSPAARSPTRARPRRRARRRTACASSRSSTASTRSREPSTSRRPSKLPRLYDADYAILALLDRAGLVPPVADRPRRAARPRAQAPSPTASPSSTRRPDRPPQRRRCANAPAPTASRRCCTRSPATASRSPRHAPAPAISPRREWRALEQHRAGRLAHDLHALAWAIALHRTVGELATDNWRTPRYATGRYPVPQLGSGHKRHPITLNEIDVPDGHAILDVARPFTEIKPDLSLELRIDALKLTFDLLVELDLTGRPSYNREKFLAYDAFLTGWALAHPRYRTHETRPVVVFVCRDARRALACAQEADRVMTGRIGVMGTPRTSGTTPAATTSSSPPSPTSTTARSTRSRSRRSRPRCARS